MLPPLLMSESLNTEEIFSVISALLSAAQQYKHYLLYTKLAATQPFQTISLHVSLNLNCSPVIGWCSWHLNFHPSCHLAITDWKFYYTFSPFHTTLIHHRQTPIPRGKTCSPLHLFDSIWPRTVLKCFFFNSLHLLWPTAIYLIMTQLQYSNAWNLTCCK